MNRGQSQNEKKKKKKKDKDRNKKNKWITGKKERNGEGKSNKKVQTRIKSSSSFHQLAMQWSIRVREKENRQFDMERYMDGVAWVGRWDGWDGCDGSACVDPNCEITIGCNVSTSRRWEKHQCGKRQPAKLSQLFLTCLFIKESQ